MKDDLPFFEHDNDAISHPRMQALFAQYGFEGYGRFWALNERIASATGAILDVSTKVIKYGLAAYLRMKPAELEAFLAFLADPEECGLISYQADKITTQRVQDSYQRVKRDREAAKARKAGGRGAHKAPDPAHNHGSAEPHQSSPEPSESSPEPDKNERTNELTKSSFVSEAEFEPSVGALEAPPAGSVQTSAQEAESEVTAGLSKILGNLTGKVDDLTPVTVIDAKKQAAAEILRKSLQPKPEGADPSFDQVNFDPPNRPEPAARDGPPSA